MLSLRNIEYIIYQITFVIAYLIAETLSGWFRAYMAKRMGDDGPETAGFLSFNPLVHIDPVGIFFLLFYGFGWGRACPINPYVIYGPWKKVKLALAYFSDTAAHLFIGMVSLIILLIAFGARVLMIAPKMIYYQHISLSLLTEYFPESSSLDVSFAMILVALIYLCIMLAVLNFIINGFRFIMIAFFEESIGLWYIDLLIPIFLILFFAEPLRYTIITSMMRMAFNITQMVGGL